MKRLIPLLLLISVFSCSEDDQTPNNIFVNIVEPNETKLYSMGESFRLMADISTPNTLKSISIFVGTKEIEISQFNSSKEHTIDTTFRINPVVTSTDIKIRAEDNLGNFEDRITLEFSPFQLPQSCLNSNGTILIVALPSNGPDEDIYVHGDFNNNLLGDSDYQLFPIPETINCVCIGLPPLDIIVQFNRGAQNTINQSSNCTNELIGITGQSPALLGVILDKWKDIDCN